VSDRSIPKTLEQVVRPKFWPTRHLILLGILILLFSCSLSIGAVTIPFLTVWQILAGHDLTSTSWQTIIWQFRWPKAVTAVFAGSALAVSGLQMQTLFQNALAGPYVLGLSSGASLGVALLVLGTGQAALIKTGAWSSVIAASLGAMAVMGLLAVIAPYVKSSISLLVIGLLLGYVTGAAVNILLFFRCLNKFKHI
jgi:iron complex transport system permease protein